MNNRRTLRLSLLVGTFVLSVCNTQAEFEAPGDNWYVHSRWGEQGSANGQFNQPNGIAVDTDNLYVADSGNHRIQVFGKDGSFKYSWGTYGSADGQFNGPTGIDVDDLYVYIVDRENHRIEVFTKQGGFVRKWGVQGSSNGKLSYPYGIAIDDQQVFITDTGNHRVQVFTKDGIFVRSWGGYGSVLTLFDSPLGIDVDMANVYVTDSPVVTEKRVQVFTKDGTFVRSWTVVGGGPAGGLANAVVSEGNNLYFTFFFNKTNSSDAASGIQIYTKSGDSLWNLIWRWPEVYSTNPTGIAADSPFLYLVAGNIVTLKRYFRTDGPPQPNSVPVTEIASVRQRQDTSILDVDYKVIDHDDATVTVYPCAFVNGTAALANLIPMRTFIDGTQSNVGNGVPTGQVRRISWDMAADWNVDYGDVNVAVLAKDGELLDLHFLSMPAVGSNPPLVINRSPLVNADFLPLWFWFLASGDPGIRLTDGKVYGVGGSYHDQLLAEGETTTDPGRAFLFPKMGLRQATPVELQRAREASTPGSVTQWEPRFQLTVHGQNSPVKVNEFNFDTGATVGWWVVKDN